MSEHREQDEMLPPPSGVWGQAVAELTGHLADVEEDPWQLLARLDPDAAQPVRHRMDAELEWMNKAVRVLRAREHPDLYAVGDADVAAAHRVRAGDLAPVDLVTLAAADKQIRVDSLVSPLALALLFEHGGYQRFAHVEHIAERIATTEHRSKRLFISIGSQTGKTLITAIYGVFWWLATHPGHRVIITSYAAFIATKRASAVRALVKQVGHLYGLVLEPGSAAKDDFQLTNHSTVMAAGLEGPVTGNPADLLLVDDPHSNRQAAIGADGEHAWDNFREAASTRVTDGCIIVIMTRWGHMDLAGRMFRSENAGRWERVILPSEADPDDPLGRAVGGPLQTHAVPDSDHDKLVAYWVAKRNELGVESYTCIYLCKPQSSATQIASYERLQDLVDTPPPMVRGTLTVAVDPNVGGSDEVGIVAGHVGTDRRFWVIADRSMHGGSEAWMTAVVRLAVELGTTRVVIEKNAGGDQNRGLLRRIWAEVTAGGPHAHTVPQILLPWASKSKRDRAEPFKIAISQDTVRFADEFTAMFGQIATFVPGQKLSPGRLDAVVWLHDALSQASPGAAGGETEVQVPPRTPLPGPLPGTAGGIPHTSPVPGVGTNPITPALDELLNRRYR